MGATPKRRCRLLGGGTTIYEQEPWNPQGNSSLFFLDQTMTAPDFAARRRLALKKARSLPHHKGRIDAFLISRVEDVGYLSGFSGDDSFLLISDKWSCLLTDGRYGEQARDECPHLAVYVRKGTMSAAIADCLVGKAVRRLAVQAEHLVLRWQDVLAKALPRVRIVQVADAVAGIRQSKDAKELASIRKAIRIAESAFKALTGRGRSAFVGRTERQVAAELDYLMRLAGADKPSFDTIVACGANAALPHYRPKDKAIGASDIVLIDWGAFAEGYCSDLTRVVFPGRIPPKIAEIYDVVRRAQLAGVAAVAAGKSAKSVDAAARAVIADAGYEKQFVHGLGHGIGRQIHELPGISHLSTSRLRSGMVVTIEPGIYLPGLGGVRIEDDVLVARGGHRKLSSLPTAIEEMALS